MPWRASWCRSVWASSQAVRRLATGGARSAGRRIVASLLPLAVVLSAGCGHDRIEAYAAPTEICYLVDLDRARVLGWAPGGVPDDVALIQVGLTVQRRIRSRLGLYASLASDQQRRLTLRFDPELDEHDRARVHRLLLLLGTFEFAIVAKPADFVEQGVSLADERRRMSSWLERNPRAPSASYSALGREDGGPAPSLRWVPPFGASDTPGSDDRAAHMVPVIRPSWDDERFDGFDVARVSPSLDDMGRPAVGLELLEDRRDDFEAFTGAHAGRALAMISEGRVMSAPTIADAVGGSMIVRAGFTVDDVSHIVAGFDPSQSRGFLRAVPMDSR